jgi:hypothetical protein
VGQTPEGVAISPDGRFVSVTVMNGSNKPKSSPFYGPGLVKIFQADGPKLRFVSEAKIGHWNQGMAWSRDGRTILAQNMVENSLSVLSFDGRSCASPAK